ncbi:MAG TPA: serine hydrolase [Spirochaetia bacterium]|nr:serine hydrolase [Spirochaetia bacterium]
MSSKLTGLDPQIEASMKDWMVPGLALAVVEGDRLIHCAGYGSRDPAQGLPMTPETRYRMASNTKAFTAMAVAMLVDEGKVAWDTPVRRYIPELRLFDPYATDHLTPRDLLCHRSGLPAHDWSGWGGLDRASIPTRLAYLEPSCDIRTKLQYNNLMFMLAGYLVERVSGAGYERFVTDRILKPLGMEHSGFSFGRAIQSGNFAECYWRKGDELVLYRHDTASDPDEINPGAPAGGLVSTARDLVPWVVAHLNGGACGDTRIVSEACLTEMHTPQMIDNWPCRYPEMGHSSAALGWFVWTYRGQRLVLHGGAFGSQIVMMPSRRIGIIYLPTLGMYSNLYEEICFTVFDRLLGLDPLPWHERLISEMGKQREKEAEEKAKGGCDRKAGTHPSRMVEDFCGVYEHPACGKVTISSSGGSLFAKGAWEKLPLRHYHYDSFELLSDSGDPVVRLTFHTDGTGVVSSFSGPMERSVKDVVFTRVSS